MNRYLEKNSIQMIEINISHYEYSVKYIIDH